MVAADPLARFPDHAGVLCVFIALSTLAGGLVYALYAFSYELWDVSFIGNRFLLPTVYLYALSFIPWCSARLRRTG